MAATNSPMEWPARPAGDDALEVLRNAAWRAPWWSAWRWSLMRMALVKRAGESQLCCGCTCRTKTAVVTPAISRKLNASPAAIPPPEPPLPQAAVS